MDVDERLELVQICRKTSGDVLQECVNGFQDGISQDFVKVEPENHADLAEDVAKGSLEMWKTPVAVKSSRKRVNAVNGKVAVWDSPSPVKTPRTKSISEGLKTSSNAVSLSASLNRSSNSQRDCDISVIKVEDESLWNDVKLGGSRPVVSISLLDNDDDNALGDVIRVDRPEVDRGKRGGRASLIPDDFETIGNGLKEPPVNVFVEDDHRLGVEDYEDNDDHGDIFQGDTEDPTLFEERPKPDANDLSLNLVVEEGAIENPEENASTTTPYQKKKKKKKYTKKKKPTKPPEVDAEGNIVANKPKPKPKKKHYDLVPLEEGEEEENRDVKPSVEGEEADSEGRRRRSRKSWVSYNVDELFGEDEEDAVRQEDERDNDGGDVGMEDSQKKKKVNSF